MTKKTRTFKLSDYTMSQLRELAKARGQNMTQVLESLIEREHTKLEMEKKGEGE